MLGTQNQRQLFVLFFDHGGGGGLIIFGTQRWEGGRYLQFGGERCGCCKIFCCG